MTWFYQFPDEDARPVLGPAETEKAARAQVRKHYGLKRLPPGVRFWATEERARTWVRDQLGLSEDPNEDHSTGTVRELFWSYRRGFLDGVADKTPRKEFTTHPTRSDLTTEYQLGYEEGRRMRSAALDDAAKRIGYIPTVLRVCEENPNETNDQAG